MNIEHKYLYHIGFESTIKGDRMSFKLKSMYGNVSVVYDTKREYYTTDEEYTSDEYKIHFSHVMNYFEKNKDKFPGITHESFKLFKRSNTIKKILYENN